MDEPKPVATEVAEEAEETKTEEAPPEAPPEEEQQEPEQSEQEEEASSQIPAEDTGEEQAPPQMSRRKAERLEKLESLVERLKGPEPSGLEPPKPPDFREVMDADDNLFQQIEDRTAQYGKEVFNAGLEEAKSIRFQTRLEVDAPRVETKYPIFDKNSPEFNPAVADSINRMYLATVGFNAKTGRVANDSVRYSDFVEGLMELGEAVSGPRTAQTAKNIAQQAASTGLRPDGTSSKPLDLNKPPEKMTDEELEAAMAAALPERDTRGRFIKRS